MKFKKFRKIYRIVFPIKYTETELFENQLKSNPLITHFKKNNSEYILEVENSFNLILRNQNFSDYDVFKQIFNHKEYDIVLKMMKLNSNLQNEKIIIDAGANVGYTSIFFSNHLKSASIYGIEPSNANFEIFEKNIKFLIKPESIKTYNKALCEKSNMTFKTERNFRNKMDWAITTKEDDEGEIQGITIDQVIQDNNLEYISLLKIDIEGAERFVFKEGNDFSFLEKTQIIAIEIHDEFPVREEIYNILRINGFFIFEAGETTIGLNKRCYK
jgi:FkbM family methyltransferase